MEFETVGEGPEDEAEGTFKVGAVFEQDMLRKTCNKINKATFS